MKGEAMKKTTSKTLSMCAVFAALAPLAIAAPQPVAAAQKVHAAPQVPMPRFRFENFTTANGLPDNHVFSVLVDGDRIWAGTENGLAVY